MSQHKSLQGASGLVIKRNVLKRFERVEILRFHQMGKDKWEKLGLAYQLDHTEPPSAELTERVREQFRKRGLLVY